MASQLATYEPFPDEYAAPAPAITMPGLRGGALLPAMAFLGISAVFSLLAFLAPDGASHGYVLLSMLALLGMTGAYYVLRLLAGRKIDPFSLDNFFIVGLLAYNGGIWLQVLFGLLPFSVAYYLPSPENINRAVLLVAAGLPAFLAGYLIRQAGTGSRTPSVAPQISAAGARRLWKLGMFIFLLAVLFRFLYIFVITGAGAYFSGKYMTMRIQETPGGRLYGISETMTMIGVIAIVVGHGLDKRKLAPKLFWPFFAAHVLLLLVDGERGTVFVTLLSLAFARHILIKRVPWTVLILGVLALGFLFAGVRVARMMERRSLSSLAQVLTGGGEELAATATLRETGGSFRNICRTMKWVPEQQSHHYGLNTAISSVTGIVPGLRGLIGRWAGPSFVRMNMSPAGWLTYTESGFSSQPTSGLGFSSIADAYLNFGYLGVIFVFPLAGFLVRHLELSAYSSPTLVRLFLLILLASQLFYWSRSHLSYFARPLVWGGLVAWIAGKVKTSAYCFPEQ